MKNVQASFEARLSLSQKAASRYASVVSSSALAVCSDAFHPRPAVSHFMI
jgi:hypothetical protein